MKDVNASAYEDWVLSRTQSAVRASHPSWLVAIALGATARLGPERLRGDIHMAAYSSCLEKELGMDQYQALPKSLQLIVASPEAADAAKSKSGESSPLQNTASPQTN